MSKRKFWAMLMMLAVVAMFVGCETKQRRESYKSYTRVVVKVECMANGKHGDAMVLTFKDNSRKKYDGIYGGKIALNEEVIIEEYIVRYRHRCRIRSVRVKGEK